MRWVWVGPRVQPLRHPLHRLFVNHSLPQNSWRRLNVGVDRRGDECDDAARGGGRQKNQSPHPRTIHPRTRRTPWACDKCSILR